MGLLKLLHETNEECLYLFPEEYHNLKKDGRLTSYEVCPPEPSIAHATQRIMALPLLDSHRDMRTLNHKLIKEAGWERTKRQYAEYQKNK